jgi:hypothetical protein
MRNGGKWKERCDHCELFCLSGEIILEKLSLTGKTAFRIFTAHMLWFIFFLLGGDLGYTIHDKWFQISRHEYDLLNYYGMAFVKGFIFLLFLLHYIAIRMVLRRKKA